jgi:hypothetical protein
MKRQRNQSFVLLFTSLSLIFALVGGTWTTAYGAGPAVQRISSVAFIIPTISIVSVQADQSVTVKSSNFPANDTFTVLMNYMGTRGVGGVTVDTVDSGSGGAITWTFNIPDSLKAQQRIAIRLQSPTSGYYSYNWFWNNTAGGIPPTGPTPTPGPWLPPGTIPTFSIQSVVRDATVTIKTAHFPANDTFNVLMNYMGTRGVGGVQVDTINSGAGGTLTMTFNIPDLLKGEQRIAIRLQSPTSGYYSYNWFWNNTTGGIPPTGPTPTPGPWLPPGTIPTISISSVVKDGTVTVQTHNFPANDDFIVLMNYIGTRGVGGAQVDSFNSGAGGSFSKTFNIPASLKGQQRIAIRIYSPTSGYYAFNWFWNNTAP